ncbi:hypothetical protein AB0K35_28390 [Micromonospora sp. NPDC053740]|uniref:hypothetical protein n=1 Tax=Micromonospora sp. NPDC053740 TaxID=3155173 RepID=UPI0034298CC1
MTVFDLIAARRNTPNWPPFDGDIWTDRNGREWLADIVVLPGDNAIIGFREGNTSCLPRYALEKHGPLTLTSKGVDRLRFEQLPPSMRAEWAAHLASACWDCGPEGATASWCDDCYEADPECKCEEYDCAGECCGVGNCTCTPAPGDPHPRGGE